MLRAVDLGTGFGLGSLRLRAQGLGYCAVGGGVVGGGGWGRRLDSL